MQAIGSDKRSLRPRIAGPLLLVYGGFVCWRLVTRGLEIWVLVGGLVICLAVGILGLCGRIPAAFAPSGVANSARSYRGNP